MDFTDEVRMLATRFRRVAEHLQTKEHLRAEAATINGLVMPFLQMMGYSVFDLDELVPEFPASAGAQKEKVDLAIMRDGQPTIVIECKSYPRFKEKTEKYIESKYISKLADYFHFTQARFGILTDGISYRFFTDPYKPNIMDLTPFFEFDFLDYTDPQVKQLKHFTKSDFDSTGAEMTRTQFLVQETKSMLATDEKANDKERSES